MIFNFTSCPCFTISYHIRSYVKILQRRPYRRQNNIKTKPMGLLKTNLFFTFSRSKCDFFSNWLAALFSPLICVFVCSLKSPSFRRQNFAKTSLVNAKRRGYSYAKRLTELGFVLSNYLCSNVKISQEHILIKGETMAKQRGCNFFKRSHFSPLFCCQNLMSFQPYKSLSFHYLFAKITFVLMSKFYKTS